MLSSIQHVSRDVLENINAFYTPSAVVFHGFVKDRRISKEERISARLTMSSALIHQAVWISTMPPRFESCLTVMKSVSTLQMCATTFLLTRPWIVLPENEARLCKSVTRVISVATLWTDVLTCCLQCCLQISARCEPERIVSPYPSFYIWTRPISMSSSLQSSVERFCDRAIRSRIRKRSA